MPKEKLIARHTNMIVASSSSSASDDHELLGASQEHALETLTATLDAGSSSVMSPRKRGFPSQGIHLPGSNRLSKRTTFQYKFVFPSHRHVNNF
jgi:hypothetical protein